MHYKLKILLSTLIFSLSLHAYGDDEFIQILVAGVGVEYGMASACVTDINKLKAYEVRVVEKIRQARVKNITHNFLIGVFFQEAEGGSEMMAHVEKEKLDCPSIIESFNDSLVWDKGFSFE